MRLSKMLNISVNTILHDLSPPTLMAEHNRHDFHFK